MVEEEGDFSQGSDIAKYPVKRIQTKIDLTIQYIIHGSSLQILAYKGQTFFCSFRGKCDEIALGSGFSVYDHMIHDFSGINRKKDHCIRTIFLVTFLNEFRTLVSISRGVDRRQI